MSLLYISNTQLKLSTKLRCRYINLSKLPVHVVGRSVRFWAYATANHGSIAEYVVLGSHKLPALQFLFLELPFAHSFLEKKVDYWRRIDTVYAGFVLQGVRLSKAAQNAQLINKRNPKSVSCYEVNNTAIDTLQRLSQFTFLTILPPFTAVIHIIAMICI